ncbi:MAG: hypothetical protein PHR21_03125 [Oscillospiraceae bacterium]|nr:hypothetical protein [Oscillospiraceae bacterium]MDD4369070.1 hypothetical protein [Oscillospiraceae bacterium]
MALTLEAAIIWPVSLVILTTALLTAPGVYGKITRHNQTLAEQALRRRRHEQLYERERNAAGQTSNLLTNPQKALALGVLWQDLKQARQLTVTEESEATHANYE